MALSEAVASPPIPQVTTQDQMPSQAIERTMRLSILEGGFTQLFLNWTTGSVLIGYMLHYGASPTELGLIASVPLLAQTLSPATAWLAGMVGRRKLLTALMALIGRGAWVLAALLPQLGIPPAAMPTLLVVLVAFSSLFQASAGTLWASLMGDVVPEERRGRYFGLRTGVVGVVGMLGNLGAGWFLDRVAAPLNFQAVIFVGVACAVAGTVLYLFHFEPPATGSRLGFRETLSTPWQDANFRRFLVFTLYWHASVFLAAPFVFPYFLGQLGMTFTQVAIWSSIASSFALITTSQWGRVADRYGNKAVLAIGTFLTGSALPLCWILASWGGLGFIWTAAIFDALAWGAIGPAMFNLALASAPRANRVAFIAMFSLTAGLAGFLGGLLSGPLLAFLLPYSFDLGGFHWTGYHSLFVLSGLLRTQAWRLLKPIEETRAWRTRDVLRALRPWRLSSFPWRQ